MKSISKNIIIKAPPNLVDEVLSDPKELMRWMTSLVDVRNISGEGVGRTYEWTYKMLGFKFDGKTRVTAEDPGRMRKTKTDGGISSEWTFMLEPVPTGTKLTMTVAYDVPVPVLGGLAEKFILKGNEREAMTNLEHLKDLVEARVTNAGTKPRARV